MAMKERFWPITLNQAAFTSKTAVMPLWRYFSRYWTIAVLLSVGSKKTLFMNVCRIMN